MPGVSSVDPTAEIAAIKSRLAALPEAVYHGVPQGDDLPSDEWGRKAPYRDFESGSLTPKAGGRLLGAGEQSQPYVWAFQVHHFGQTRELASNLAIATDVSLIGWAPSGAASPIKPFFFNVYDERARDGELIGYIATRFYSTVLGQNPIISA